MENRDLDTAAPSANDEVTPPVLPLREEHSVFVGRFGLRAGWGIAIYLLLFAFFVASVDFATMAAHGKLKSLSSHPATSAAPAHTPAAPVEAKETKPRKTAIYEGIVFAGIVLVSWILSRMERRRVGVYGIGLYRLHDVVLGAIWGLAALSLLIGTLHALHLLVFDQKLLYGRTLFAFGGKWLLVFLLVGLLEEYLTRGYLQYTLTRGFFGLAERIAPSNARAAAFWMAAVVMSIVFSVLHLGNGGENAVGLFAVFLAGMTFSYALWRTGSLWWGIGFHMAWDWAQSFLYGVPDSGSLSAGRLFQTHPLGRPLFSGGSDGPEGSIFVIPTLLLVLLILRFTRQGIQPSLDPLPRAANDLPETYSVVA